MEYLAFDTAVEKAGQCVALQQCDYTAETGPAVCAVAEFAQQAGVVGVAVAVCACVARAHYARSTTESVNFKARVIGEAVIAVPLLYPAGFLERIFFKSGAGLRYIVVTANVAER